MELDQVRYFLALCSEKSFTRAAKSCGISQPSLSNAIRRLEVEFGGVLFYRTRRAIALSELGRELLPLLSKLDRCARAVREQVAKLSGAPHAWAAHAERIPAVHVPLNFSGMGRKRKARSHLTIRISTKSTRDPLSAT